MKSRLLTTALLLVFAGVAAHAAPAADTPGPEAAASAPAASARDQHAAECVAALEVLTQDMAKEVKAGDESQRQVLLDRLIAGTAFVGDTYLHGNSDEQQARALANRALETQKSLPPAKLATRQRACADEGTKLYADSNGLQRAVVKRLAKKRMDKLLGA